MVKREIRLSDARKLDLKDSSVDGIITSPPYSFAIDYVENDRPQLEYLGANPEILKSKMIGLAGGKSREQRVKYYFQDMKKVFDSVSLEALTCAMERIKIPEGAIRFVLNLYNKRR